MQLQPTADSPDTERKRLKAHQTQKSMYGSGKAGMIVGGVFVLIGGAIVLIGLGVIPMDPEDFNGPPELAAAFGGLFVLVGLMGIVFGARAQQRYARWKALSERYPDQPWLADYPWDNRGITDDRLREIKRTAGWVVFLAIFLAPFHWVAFTIAGGCMVAFMALFDLVLLLMIGHCVLLVLRQRKYGTSRLEFARFPFHPGETAEVGFLNENIAAYNRMLFTLRFIQECIEYRGTGKNRSQHVYCDQLYAYALETVEPGTLNWAAGPVPLTFDLPDGDVTTRLSSSRPCYWKLEVHADTPGVDLKASFLVPIY